jgi:hypothetical protein
MHQSKTSMGLADLLIFLVLGSVTLGAAQPRVPDAKDFFYDPANGQRFDPVVVNQPPHLREIKKPDTAPQFVGIHYWFEDRMGRPVTADQAAVARGTFTLHIRGNVSGFLSMWSAAGSRVRLTAEKEGPAYRQIVSEQEYGVAGDFEFTSSAAPASLFVLFSRSETEQVYSAADAANKLDSIVRRDGRNGRPQLVHTTERTIADQIGTYIVNQEGGPVVGEIIISPTLGQKPPAGFAIRFEFGVCTTDVLDTFKGVFLRDLGPTPSVSIDVSLPSEMVTGFYQAVVDARFFDYPPEIDPRTEWTVLPAESYRLTVRSAGVTHQVHWVDKSRASTDQAVRLRTLFRRIKRQLLELPEVRSLPRAAVICL